MANVTVKIYNKNATISRLKSLFYGKALPVVAETQLSDCNVYVRMQDGTLADSARVEDGGKRITWNTPYAKRVYYTGTPSKARNPNASLRWCEVAKRKYSGQWARLASDIVNGG